ncbi:MAG: hypothetical protein RR326_15935, partial [Stenotrophomonas sp.]
MKVIFLHESYLLPWSPGIMGGYWGERWRIRENYFLVSMVPVRLSWGLGKGVWKGGWTRLASAPVWR